MFPADDTRLDKKKSQQKKTPQTNSEKYCGNSGQCNESLSPARLQEPVRGYGLLQSPPDTSIWVPEISRPHLLPSLTPSDISFKLWSPPSSSIRVPLLSRSLCSSSRPLQVPPLGSFPYTLQTPPEPSFWALVMCRSLCSGLAPPCSSVCHLKDVQTLTLK